MVWMPRHGRLFDNPPRTFWPKLGYAVVWFWTGLIAGGLLTVFVMLLVQIIDEYAFDSWFAYYYRDHPSKEVFVSAFMIGIITMVWALSENKKQIENTRDKYDSHE